MPEKVEVFGWGRKQIGVGLVTNIRQIAQQCVCIGLCGQMPRPADTLSKVAPSVESGLIKMIEAKSCVADSNQLIHHRPLDAAAQILIVATVITGIGNGKFAILRRF